IVGLVRAGNRRSVYSARACCRRRVGIAGGMPLVLVLGAGGRKSPRPPNRVRSPRPVGNVYVVAIVVTLVTPVPTKSEEKSGENVASALASLIVITLSAIAARSLGLDETSRRANGRDPVAVAMDVKIGR